MAADVRFDGDSLPFVSVDDAPDRVFLQNILNRNDLKITRAVTPGLAEAIEQVSERLLLPSDSIDAYVYASPEIQAECHTGYANSCLLRFSSTLVDLLNRDEFSFVIGHELGHFLLGHGAPPSNVGTESIETFMQMRAREISSDRVGLLACGSLHGAIGAMMKSVSGLSNVHLRFDVNAFVKQLSATAKVGEHHTSSHPSLIVRCRALLWFSMNADLRSDRQVARRGEDRRQLDAQVQRDLDKYVNGPAQELINESQENLLLWALARRIVEDEVFSHAEQDIIAKLLGSEKLQSLRNYLSEMPKYLIAKEVQDKLESAGAELKELIPMSYSRVAREIEEQVVRVFGPT